MKTKYHSRRKGLATGWLALLLLAGIPVSSYGGAYQFVELGTLGGTYGNAVSINSMDQVAGTATTAEGRSHAFLWTRENGMRDLGSLGGAESWVTGINDAGQVIGFSRTIKGDEHAFIWTPQTGMKDLGTLGGRFSQPTAFNNRGQVAGVSATEKGMMRGFLWSEKDGMKKLRCLGGGNTRPLAINDAGEVVGVSYTKDGQLRAYYCDGGGNPEALCALGDCSFAWGINSSGAIIGSYTGAAGRRLFLRSPAGGQRALDRMGSRWAIVKAISDQGLIVGSLEIQPDQWRACMWDSHGRGQLLPEVKGAQSDALDVSDAGVIVGKLYYANGEHRAFAWTAQAGIQELPLGENMSSSAPMAINRKGTIIGLIEHGAKTHACLWQSTSVQEVEPTAGANRID